MDEHIKIYIETQNEIKDSIDEVNITLVRHEETLKQHIYRTEMAEKRLDKLEDNVEPVRVKMGQLEGALKLIGGIAIVLTIIAAIVQIIRP